MDSTSLHLHGEYKNCLNNLEQELGINRENPIIITQGYSRDQSLSDTLRERPDLEDVLKVFGCIEIPPNPPFKGGNNLLKVLLSKEDLGGSEFWIPQPPLLKHPLKTMYYLRQDKVS